ncbi:MAG: MBL fold metallo-hydrolase [Actinomycetota bacterium]
MTEPAPHRPLRQEQRPARDDVEEVAAGVLRIQLPIDLPGLGHVNCYVLEDRNGLALVDPGLPGRATRRSLAARLRSAGLSIDRVHTVVVTHSHPDHFGQAGWFRKAGAEIITHRSFRTFLDPEAEADDQALETTPAGPDHTTDLETGGAERPPGRDRSLGPFSPETPWGGRPYELPLSRRIRYRAMRLAAGRIFSVPRPTRRVADADVLVLGEREWVAVHTPGHTEDHLCLWDPNGGIMISGDHVLPTITPHISGLTDDPDPLAKFFDSLDRMSTFDGVTTVLPAHGLEFGDLCGRADAISRHHHDRLDALREAGEKLGQGTVEEYMKELFKPRSWGPMAESETYAHLQYLRLRNEAETNSDGALLRYAIKD